MKNKIIIIILFIVSIAFLIFIYLNIKYKNNHNIGEFYLEDNYYNNNGLTDISKDELENLINTKKSFILFTYNNFCTFSIPCEEIFSDVAKNNNFEILQIPFTDFKEISLYKKVKYAPSIILIKQGEIVDYLDTNSNNDLEKYQNREIFLKWIKKYVSF